MRLLMFPQYAYPCDHAMLDTVFARILPARGHEVRWIMSGAADTAGRSDARWHDTAVTVLPRRHGGPAVNAVATLAWIRAAGRAVRGLRPGEVDIVQVRNEISSSLVALRLRHRIGARFVYQQSSPDAEFRIAAARDGRIRPAAYHRARGGAELRLRRAICRRADAVLAISETMRAHTVEVEGVRPDRAFAVPLGYDATLAPPAEDVRRIRERYGQPAGHLLLYLGIVAESRKLDLLVEVLARVVAHEPATRLLVVGPGETDLDLRSLGQAFEARGLGRAVAIVGPVPRLEAAAFTSAATLSLAPYPPSFVFRVVSPTKVLESIGLGVPAIGNEGIPDLETVIRASGGGVVVPYRAEAFATAVLDLLARTDERQRMGARGRDWVRANRSYDVLATRLEDIYRQIAPPAAGRSTEGAGENIRVRS